MKKKLLIAIAAAGMMYSCGGGASKEELKTAADKICGCMADKVANRGEVSEDLLESTESLDYTMCALDVALTGIDPFSADFTASISENCPELDRLQESYVNGQDD
ncbi:MAG: hypothetical protein ABF242_10075 [Flavobacteriales bacterium]